MSQGQDGPHSSHGFCLLGSDLLNVHYNPSLDVLGASCISLDKITVTRTVAYDDMTLGAFLHLCA